MSHTLPARIDNFTGQWGFLALSHPWPVVLPDGSSYHTPEHALWASKTDDPGERRWVAESSDSEEVRKRGRRVTPSQSWVLDSGVSALAAVIHSTYCRGFSPVPSTRVQSLLSTGDAELVNGNTRHDNHWGDCLCGEDPCAGRGDNLLGIALTGLRQALSNKLYVVWYIATCPECGPDLGVPFRRRYQADHCVFDHAQRTRHAPTVTEEVTL